MSGTRPPHGVITERDHGPYVALTVYILLVTMLLTLFTRMIMRFQVIRTLKSDDYLLTLATVRQSIFSTLSCASCASCELTVYLLGSGDSTECTGNLFRKARTGQTQDRPQ